MDSLDQSYFKPIFLNKVLYISYDGLTDPQGNPRYYLIWELSKHGFQFTILSFEKRALSKRKSIVSDALNSSGIKWVPLWFTSAPVLSKIYDRWHLKRKVLDAQAGKF
jgi:hypothetical protein